MICICSQDVGFDGISPVPGTDDNVINKYFTEFFPQAVRVSVLSLSPRDSKNSWAAWGTDQHLQISVRKRWSRTLAVDDPGAHFFNSTQS